MFVSWEEYFPLLLSGAGSSPDLGSGRLQEGSGVGGEVLRGSVGKWSINEAAKDGRTTSLCVLHCSFVCSCFGSGCCVLLSKIKASCG